MSQRKISRFSRSPPPPLPPSHFSNVHYWINNAAINGGRRSFVELSPKTIEAVVKVNLLGTLYCTQVFNGLLKAQPRTCLMRMHTPMDLVFRRRP